MTDANGTHIILSVMDGKGVKHDILSDDFGHSAISDVLERLKMLEALVAELVRRDAIVGKDLRLRAAVFVKEAS